MERNLQSRRRLLWYTSEERDSTSSPVCSVTLVMVQARALLFVTVRVPKGIDDGWHVGLMPPTNAEGQCLSQLSDLAHVVAFESGRYDACRV